MLHKSYTSPACGATDIPYFGLLVTSALGLKARVDPLIACFVTCVILRFTSGVTPADWKGRSAQQEAFFDPHTCKSCIHKHWWGFEPLTVRATAQRSITLTLFPIHQSVYYTLHDLHLITWLCHKPKSTEEISRSSKRGYFCLRNPAAKWVMLTESFPNECTAVCDHECEGIH